MNEKINLKDMERRANQLLSQDGLVEILLGAILFVSSASFVKSGSWVPFLPIYVIFMKNIIEGFRKRFTYPRIGYVKMPDETSTDIGTGILKYMGIVMVVLVMGILLLYGRLHSDLIYQWTPTGIGLFLAGALYYMYSSTGDRINLVHIGVVVLGGFAFSLRSLEGKVGIQFYLLSMAGFFIVVGMMRFILFTQRHPMMEASGDE